MTSAFGILFGPGMAYAWLELALAACALAVAVYALAIRRRYQTSREDRRNVAELIDNLSEGIYRSSLDGRQLSANRALVRLNGYETEAEMLKSVKDIAVEWYVQPGRREEFREILHRDGHIEDFISEIYRHKTRDRIWVTEAARIVCDAKSGKPLYYEGSVREITETVHRLQAEERFHKLTAAVPGVLFQCVIEDDGTLRIPYISGGFEQVTGLSSRLVREKASIFLDCIAPEDRKGFLNSLETAVKGLEAWDYEFRFNAAGTEKWCRFSATIERTGTGVTLHGYLNDISIRKRQAIEIEKLAYYDALTQLPNRRMLGDRLLRAVETCRAERRYGALLFIDLDNFKTLNDTQGHDVGDEYLVQVADRLRRAVGPSDTVARIGGDEFVVVLSDIGFDPATGACKATDIARSILSELSSSFHLGIVQHQSSASIGFVAFDGEPVRVEELLKRADLAMYEAKASGRNNIAVFNPETLANEAERYRMIGDLRFAISEHRFQFALQPQVTRDGRIRGAQAAMRWHHPDKGVITASGFAPLAAQIGLSDELGKVIVSTALTTLRRWQSSRTTADLRLSVNVGVGPLSSLDFLSFLERYIARSGVDASRLTIEISDAIEEADYDSMRACMERMKRCGIRFSLDRFGTGKPPLTCLKALPFDEIRIVGTFVTDIHVSHYDKAVAEHMFRLAASLGLMTVAGDVATPEQEAVLLEIGCDAFQGPNYGAALPENLFLDYVLATTRREPGEPAEAVSLRA